MTRAGLLVVGTLMLLPCGMRWASAEEPVVNNPSGAYQTFKKVVDVLDPQVEELYDFKSKEWRHGTSASVWRFTSNEIHLASLRVGYAFDQDPFSDAHDTVYGGLKLDVPGLVQRLTPSSVEAWVSGQGMLNTTTALLGKYAAVGVVAGRDLSGEEPVYGLSVGGRVTW